MPKKIDTRKLNVVQSIIYKEIGLLKNSYRQNLRIINSIVKSDNTIFNQIWYTQSNKPIIHSDGKLYMENYNLCLAICGHDSLPSPLYRLKKSDKFKKFEDVLIFTAPIGCTPLPREEFSPFFMGLTDQNSLMVYNNNTGQVLREIYLGPKESFKFLNLDWETQGETIVVQSSFFPYKKKNNSHTVQVMALFKIYPIKFIGMIEINQMDFGKEVNSANVSEGLIILGLGSGNSRKIHIYNLNCLFDQPNKLFDAQLFSYCDALNGKVGVFPSGLPLNYKVKSLPPLLLDVKCSEQVLHFGGFPFHYVTQPPKASGVFEVRNVATEEIAENGIIDIPNYTTEPDNLSFHLDDSGRLVYESANFIRFYKLSDTENSKKIVKPLFDLKVRSESIRTSNSFSSRQASRCVNYNPEERTIVCDDYENELELYLLLGIDKNLSKNGKIVIFNNENGSVVKDVKLNFNLDEDCNFNLVMDLDTLVITYKKDSKYRCYLFRMDKKDLEEEKLVKSEDKKSVKIKSVNKRRKISERHS